MENSWVWKASWGLTLQNPVSACGFYLEKGSFLDIQMNEMAAGKAFELFSSLLAYNVIMYFGQIQFASVEMTGLHAF